MIVTEIFIYPIKSCQGISLKQAEVTPKGFTCDREFMLVDHKSKFITQRQYPQLAKIKVEVSSKTLTLSKPGSNIPAFNLKPTFKGREIAVEVWRDHTIAIDQGDEVAKWFEQAIELNPQKNCRLVRQSPKHQRRIEGRYGVKEDDQVSFADGYPFLLTTSASLVELNRRIREFPGQTQEVKMERFRPNIVVATIQPFIEGDWKVIKIGKVKFALVKPCSRCIITTVDQATGERDQLKEPLRTLSTFRQFGNEGVMFGENMISRSQGVVKVGDPIKILEWKEKVEVLY